MIRNLEDQMRAAAICYRVAKTQSPSSEDKQTGKFDSIEILLIRTHGNEWAFPKGRLEAGEEAWQAARREAFEEAGVTGEIRRNPLTTFLYFKPGSHREIQVVAFLLLVTETQPPGEPERKPRWFTLKQAEAALVQGRQPRYADEFRRVIRLAIREINPE